MMLRNRNVNVPQENNNGAGPLKRQATKNTKAAAVDESIDKSVGEPKAKRVALSDLSQVRQGLSGVVLDSAKKAKGDAKKAQPQRRALGLIEKNSNIIRSNVAVKPPKAVVPKVQPVVAAAAVPVVVDPCPGYDYDKECAKDITAVSEYAREIFQYYKFREAQFKIGHYFDKQPQIDEYARATLVDWLIQIQEQFELNHETLYLAVRLMDMYLDRTPNVKANKLQLIGGAAVFLASKYDERSAPIIDDFLYMGEDSFTRDEFVRMERELFRCIGYDLGMPISYRFLRRFSRVNKTDMATLTLARYILETSLMFLDFCRVSESLVAAAALLLAIRMKNLGGWTLPLQKYSGYEAKDVEPLMWALNHMMIIRATDYSHLRAATTKYSHEIFYEVAYTPALYPDPLASDPRVAPPAELLQPSPSISGTAQSQQQKRRL